MLCLYTIHLVKEVNKILNLESSAVSTTVCWSRYVTPSASVRRSKPVQHKIYLWNKVDLDTMKGGVLYFNDQVS